MLVNISNDTLLDMLCDRVRVWRDGKEAYLLCKMYENYIDEGVFDGGDFDPMIIVDNDVVNNCQTIEAGEKDFDKLIKLYKNGDYDVSCEDFEEYKISFIEAVDDEKDPTMFLVRL